MPQLEPIHLKLTGSAEGLSAALREGQQKAGAFKSGMGGLFSGFSGMAAAAGPAVIAIGSALAAITAAAVSAGIAIAKIGEQFKVIDDLTDSANRLGVSFSELRGLRLALGEATGLEGGAIDAAIAKLQINLGEAAQSGKGQVVDALREIGLSAEDLLAAGPMKAIAMIAAEVAKVDDKSKQLKLSFDILGKSGIALAAALRESPDQLQEAYEWAQKNLGLTQEQVEAVGRSNDAWDRINALVETFFQQLAAEAAPAVEAVAKEILAIIDSMGGIKKITETLITEAARWAGWFKDIYELVTAIQVSLGDLSRLDLTDPVGQLEKAFQFDQADAFVAALEKARESMRNRPEKPKGPSEAEIAALESTTAAAEAAAEAAKAVEQKANSIAAATREPLLAATTDRAEQIRRIAELRQRETTTERVEAEQLQELKDMGKDIASMVALLTRLEPPAPINID